MAQRFSDPGIKLVEKDVSEIVRPLGTSTGAIVGQTEKGPVNQRVLVQSDQDFIEVFGEPDIDSFDYSAYAAVEFLKESNALYFVRGSNGTEKYANMIFGASGSVSASTTNTASDSTALVAATTDGNKTDEIYDLDNLETTGGLFNIAAIGPGAYGNNFGIKITTSASLSDSATSADVDWKYSYDEPGNVNVGDAVWGKVFKVEVFVKNENDATFANVSANTPDETWYVSRHNITSPNGSQLNIESVINGVSKYIYVKNGSGTTLPGDTNGAVVALAEGSNGSGAVDAADRASAWTLFTDKEKVDVSILIESQPASSGNISLLQSIANIAESRKDCIAILQGDTGATATNAANIITDANNNSLYGFTNPSYAALYAGWSKVFDRYTSKKISLPNSIYGAVIIARTDRVANVWDAPAGINRGVLPVIGQNVQFNSAQRGLLYDANFNVTKFVSGTGNVMWGQKTAQRKATALDRINVRRLLIFIEKTLENALVPFLFEQNTEALRLRVFSLVDPFLANIKSGGGLTSYKVVVDESNNTQIVIDNNQLNLDIFLAPSRTVEFIQLRAIVTNTGVNFSEVQL